MKKRCILLMLPVVAPLLTGCVTVSLHSTRPVEVRVTERESGKPAERVHLEISYSYIGYGVFYILRVPKSAWTQTDEQGIAILPMADFSQSIVMCVNRERFLLTKELVRQGGVLTYSYSLGVGFSQPYVLQLTPQK